jgi:thiol-disulfide isomerase/thioredoxin
VNFWATWCRPCRAELPDFVETYKALKAKGVEFVGIAVDQQGWSIVTPFVAKAKIIYPIVLPDNHVLSDYGRIDGIPTTFIIDRSGTIVEHHVGGLSRAELTRKLEQVL